MASTPELLAQGEQLAAAALDLAQHEWRDRLVAAYALGSLAHGGFSAVSDIDVAFVLGDPLLATDSESVSSLVDSIKASRKPFADRLSVFWGSVRTLTHEAQGGRFPPLDRLDLIKYGRLIAGTDVRTGLRPPSRKELVVAGAEFALWRLATGEVIAKIRNAESLARSDSKTLTKLILYPVRFMFTAQTGDVGRNEAAVEHYVARAKGPAAALVRLALDWRNQAPPPGDVAAVRAVSAGAVPLYEDFLSDHEDRLRHYERQDLAQAFSKWRQDLQASVCMVDNEHGSSS